jgi:hypothetical protein
MESTAHTYPLLLLLLLPLLGLFALLLKLLLQLCLFLRLFGKPLLLLALSTATLEVMKFS